MPILTPAPIAPSTLRPDPFPQEMDAFLAWMVIHRDELVAMGSAWALGTSAISSSTVTFGTGVKSLIAEPGKGFMPGMSVVIASIADGTQRMLGVITDYNSTTGAMTVSVVSNTGTGTASSWAVSLGTAVDFGQVITPDGVATLSNKTMQGVTEVRVDLGSGANIDLSAGNYFRKTITANTTFTLSNVPAPGKVGYFLMDLTNAGAFTTSLWSGVMWSGGAVPVLTAIGRDVLSFVTVDGGSTWIGAARKDVR